MELAGRSWQAGRARWFVHGRSALLGRRTTLLPFASMIIGWLTSVKAVPASPARTDAHRPGSTLSPTGLRGRYRRRERIVGEEDGAVATLFGAGQVEECA